MRVCILVSLNITQVRLNITPVRLNITPVSLNITPVRLNITPVSLDISLRLACLRLAQLALADENGNTIQLKSL